MHGRDNLTFTIEGGLPIKIVIGPIFVTQADIDAANAARDGNSYDAEVDCPIAQSLRRRYPFATAISVGLHDLWIVIHGVKTTLRMSDEAQEFMRAFDRYFEVTPQTFALLPIYAVATA